MADREIGLVKRAIGALLKRSFELTLRHFFHQIERPRAELRVILSILPALVYEVFLTSVVANSIGVCNRPERRNISSGL